AGVPEEQRPPGLNEVDVAATVGVDEIRALAPFNEHRRSTHRTERADRRVHASGDDAPGSLEQLLRAAGSHSGGSSRSNSSASRRARASPDSSSSLARTTGGWSSLATMARVAASTARRSSSD